MIISIALCEFSSTLMFSRGKYPTYHFDVFSLIHEASILFRPGNDIQSGGYDQHEPPGSAGPALPGGEPAVLASAMCRYMV